MKNFFQSILLTAFAVILSVCAISAQTVTIKSFEPNSADGQAILQLLQGMNKTNYSIQVAPEGKTIQYGALGSESAKVSSIQGVDALSKSKSKSKGKWVSKILTSIITSTSKAYAANVAEIQKIAAKYKN